jgi:rieske iron-sulfur protein
MKRAGGCCGRRAVLGGGLGIAAVGMAAGGVIAPARADDSDTEPDPAKSERPQPGDMFVFYEGDKAGQVITPADIALDALQVIAWPMNPKTKLVRDGSRLNQVLLIRLDPATLDETEKPRAAGGIIAFSAICTHAQCTVTNWKPDEKVLQCLCHGSEYDPRQACKVTFGPAPRALPALPLKISDGALVSAGSFLGRVGMAPA